jgi:hypothetical protein
MPQASNRVVYPPEGWQNPLDSESIGLDRFGNGQMFDVSLQDSPLVRLIYDRRDDQITVRCLRCDQQDQAGGRFQDYRMIGIVSINATVLLIPMNTPRVMKHLADVHDEILNGIDDLNFFNCILDCCEL